MLFILHADHEQNCSTNAMRVDRQLARRSVLRRRRRLPPRSTDRCTAARTKQVIRMLTEIGSMQNIPAFIEKVKSGEGVKLMGFGHRVYKNYDPRAKIIKKVAYEVFEVTGKNPLLDIALELERIALEDEYFVKRKLYPNVDFYSGLIYQAMKFPMDMFPVLFAIPRVSGWLAQWQEMLQDPDQKIARPRQIFIGAGAPRRTFRSENADATFRGQRVTRRLQERLTKCSAPSADSGTADAQSPSAGPQRVRYEMCQIRRFLLRSSLRCIRVRSDQ